MIKKLLIIELLIAVLVINSQAFSAQYTFTPRASARETYSDNIDQDDNDKQDDFITDVGVGGTLSIFGRTSGLDLSFDPSYVWYQDNTSDNTWRLSAALNIWNDFSRRTRFEFYNRFLRTEDPAEDEGVTREEDGENLAPGDSTVRRGRDPYWTNYANARIDHQFGTDDSVYGRFLYSLRREEGSEQNDNEDNGDYNENDRYAPSAGLVYWFGPKWGTTVDATYTRATFDNSDDYHDIETIFQLNRRFTRHFQLFGRYAYAYRDNDGDEEERDDDDQVVEEEDYQAHAPSIGFNYEVARDHRISLGLGYYYQDFDNGDDEQGPFVNADLYKLWDYQRWSASLQGLAGLDRNDYGNERLGLEWSAVIRGTATYDFTRYFFGNVTGRYRYSDVIGYSREDNRYTVGAGLGWLPTRWMRLSLDYTFNALDSNGTENYEENRVWLRLTLQPDRPWRF